MRGAITRATTLISFINMLSAGPDVSLNGSPTVSPVIAALCVGEPLPPKFPASIYFFALSQDAPAFAINIASTTPEASTPTRSPARIYLSIKPTTTGIITAIRPGTIILFIAAYSTGCQAATRIKTTVPKIRKENTFIMNNMFLLLKHPFTLFRSNH
jgi:hypothetical protein